MIGVACSLVPYLAVFTLHMLEMLQQLFVVDLRLGWTFDTGLLGVTPEKDR